MSKVLIIDNCSSCPFCTGMETNHKGLKGYCRRTCSIVTGTEIADNCPLPDAPENLK